MFLELLFNWKIYLKNTTAQTENIKSFHKNKTVNIMYYNYKSANKTVMKSHVSNP